MRVVCCVLCGVCCVPCVGYRVCCVLYTVCGVHVGNTHHSHSHCIPRATTHPLWHRRAGELESSFGPAWLGFGHAFAAEVIVIVCGSLFVCHQSMCVYVCACMHIIKSVCVCVTLLSVSVLLFRAFFVLFLSLLLPRCQVISLWCWSCLDT